MKKTVLFLTVAVITASACNKTKTGLCECTSPSTDPGVVIGLHIVDSIYGDTKYTEAQCNQIDANE